MHESERTMAISRDEVLPLMRGGYVSEASMWAALESLGERIVAAVTRLAPGDDRRGFAIEVLAELGIAIKRRNGLAPLQDPPRNADYSGWLFANANRVAKDLRRAHYKEEAIRAAQDELEEERLRAPADEPWGDDDAGYVALIWAKLRATECRPAYRLTLFAWYWPEQLARADVQALADDVPRGKKDQISGLIRPVDDAWRLLIRFRRIFPRGVRRRGPAGDRFAWIIRSDTPAFAAWAADKRVLHTARSLIEKWHTRAREWLLEQLAQPAEGGPT